MRPLGAISMKWASREPSESTPLSTAKAGLRRAAAGLNSMTHAEEMSRGTATGIAGAAVAAVALGALMLFPHGSAPQQTTVSPVAAPRSPQASNSSNSSATSSDSGQRHSGQAPGSTAPGQVPAVASVVTPSVGPGAWTYPAEQQSGQTAPSGSSTPPRPVSQPPSPVQSQPQPSSSPSPISSLPTPVTSSPAPPSATPTPSAWPTVSPSGSPSAP